MAKVTRLTPPPAKRLKDTVFTDGGLRLPAVRRMAQSRWFLPAMLVLPAAAFLAVLFLPSNLGSGLTFGSTAPAYMSADSVWAKDPDAGRKALEASVYYAGCDEVRALGKAPLHAGQPGYREGMDGDGDGIACEAHRY